MGGANYKIGVKQILFESRDSFFYLCLGFSLLCFFLALYLDAIILFLLPFALVFGMLVAFNYRLVYLLFFVVLPFSIEIYLPNGFGTDLPTEPIMLTLTGVFLIKFIQEFHTLKKKRWLHPISVMLFLHLVWIGFMALYSVDSFVSLKYTLAKSWYVLPFFYLSLFLFERNGISFIDKIFKTLWWSLSIALVYIMVRHAMAGFAFDAINDALKPIFRNHVNYAVLLVALWPFMIYLYVHSSNKKLYGLSLILLLAAIYLSYTRAAQACVIIAGIIYVIIKYRKMIHSIALGLVLMTSLIFFLLSNNNYLKFAPDYNKAVTHHKFENLIEATYKLEDISTMERVYRWVAGFRMVADKPLTGFGPGCFYPVYKKYTINMFRTYVSDNPEKSGMHNNFLIVFVEQGVVGFLIMLTICILPLVYGERYYHQLKDQKSKNLMMATTCAVACLFAVLLINELLEADKVGPLFFICLAVIVYLGNNPKDEIPQEH